MSGYKDAHRKFMQVFFAKRILLSKETIELHKKICEQYSMEEGLSQFMNTISTSIIDAKLMVVKQIEEHPEGDRMCYVLVNTMSHDSTRLHSSFSALEMTLLRKIIEVIVNSNDGCVTEIEAVNLCSELQPRMKVTDAESSIDKFVTQHWLLKDEERNVLSLSALSVAEFSSYLENLYDDDIKKCVLCNLPTFKGYNCDQCNCRVHRQCSNKYFAKMKTHFKCPKNGCNNEWVHEKLGSN